MHSTVRVVGGWGGGYEFISFDRELVKDVAYEGGEGKGPPPRFAALSLPAMIAPFLPRNSTHTKHGASYVPATSFKSLQSVQYSKLWPWRAPDGRCRFRFEFAVVGSDFGDRYRIF